MKGEWHLSTAWISSIPDLQERIEQWREDKGMSFGFEDECYQLPDEQDNISGSSSDTIDTQSGELQLNAIPARQKPQHSLAENIFRRRDIELLIFDNEIEDGDTVDIYWNGLKIKPDLVLKGFPGTTIRLELSPSHDLPYPANRLVIFASSAGTSESEATIGIQVRDRGTISQVVLNSG
ncbi:MAG: hypothetical protein V3V18_11075 [Methylococcales bacterium]